jgi:hypothetical protein
LCRERLGDPLVLGGEGRIAFTIHDLQDAHQRRALDERY